MSVDPPHHVEHDRTTFMARGDVQEDEFVGTLGVVACGDRDGVAGVAQVEEVRPLHHPPAVDVEAGDDPLGQHRRVGQRGGGSMVN